MDIQQIVGTAKTVEQLLANSRYGLDYYQREYSWTETQVTELVDDLVVRFRNDFDPGHQRTDVASYRPYFLGPIVTVERDGVRYLVDGQQRLTTLSLLLIHLRSLLAETHPDEQASLDSLIFSRKFGETTFNLNIVERRPCLDTILEGSDFDPAGQSESVRNICERFETIRTRFPGDPDHPDDPSRASLPFFCDWLLNRVVLVDIVASDQDMALEIFETMNDRGLRLSNTDMLKSFLLYQMRDEDTIRELNDRWRRRVHELADFESNADADFIKAWLRGNHAETQRERKSKASPQDFERIGTEFHKWVRDHHQEIGLTQPEDFRRFVEHDFWKLSDRYLQLIRARWEITDGLEAVYYNAWAGVPLQLSMILASVTPDDDDSAFKEKASLVASALEIFVVRRMVNYRNFGYSTVVYTMFNLMKRLRNRPIEAVRSELMSWLDREPEQFEGILQFRLTKRNRWHIRYLLARMTSWMDSELETGVAFDDYITPGRKNPFEVEHIWADHFERHTDEFDNPDEFERNRNRFGGLLLLPKDFNASYGDMAYEDKVEHYYGQNSLARSLHPRMYENNPSFLRLRDAHSLPFRAVPTRFAKADIDERQELYRDLAEVVWAPSRHGLA